MPFCISVERHILRNYVYLHAIEDGLPIPIGPQDVELMDSRINDQDAELRTSLAAMPDEDEEGAAGGGVGHNESGCEPKTTSADAPPRSTLSTRVASNAASAGFAADLFAEDLASDLHADIERCWASSRVPATGIRTRTRSSPLCAGC